MTLLHEKADQARALLRETGLDCWLTFARETPIHPDPGIDLVVGAHVVRNSAFLFSAGGERIAIVANFDTANVRARGVFREAIGYDEDVRPALLPALRGLAAAWEWDSCPIVNCGPASEPGHASPRDDLRVEAGQLVHVDLGVRLEDYCSDLQRTWYVRRPGEEGLPPTVQRAWDAVVRA